MRKTLNLKIEPGTNTRRKRECNSSSAETRGKMKMHNVVRKIRGNTVNCEIT